MARNICTKRSCLPMKLTHVKQTNKIHKSPTVHNSYLALTKTCLIMIYYNIKKRNKSKRFTNIHKLMSAKNKKRTQARKSKVNRWLRPIHCRIHSKTPPTASLVSCLLSAGPAIWPRRDARSVNK